MGRTSRVFPQISFALALALMSVLVVTILSFLMLTDIGLDVTLSGVRIFMLVVSAVMTLFFVILLAITMTTASEARLDRLTALETEIDLAAFFWGALIYGPLSIILFIVHFKYTGTPGEFDPVVNPALNARLYFVILSYFLASIIWIGLTFIDAVKYKGAEDRRYFARRHGDPK